LTTPGRAVEACRRPAPSPAPRGLVPPQPRVPRGRLFRKHPRPAAHPLTGQVSEGCIVKQVRGRDPGNSSSVCFRRVGLGACDAGGRAEGLFRDRLCAKHVLDRYCRMRLCSETVGGCAFRGKDVRREESLRAAPENGRARSTVLGCGLECRDATEPAAYSFNPSRADEQLVDDVSKDLLGQLVEHDHVFVGTGRSTFWRSSAGAPPNTSAKQSARRTKEREHIRPRPTNTEIR